MKVRVGLWVAIGLALLTAVAAFGLGFASRGVPMPSSLENWPEHLFRFPTMLGAVGLGLLIAARQPHNRYGWLWLLFGLNYGLRLVAESYAGYALLVRPGTLPLGLEAAWLGDRLWFVHITLSPFLLVLFPDGRFPSRRWKLAGW